MSLELVNTLATFGTFFVIAATALAAIVQLRHLRRSNQIAALDELRETFDSQEFSEAQAFLDRGLDRLIGDPAFRYQFTHRSAERTEESNAAIQRLGLIGDYFENVGVFIATGLLDADVAINIYASDATRAWDQLEPITAMLRRARGCAVWEMFEYVAMLSKAFTASHPEGVYPRGASRLPVRDQFLEADKQYAASLAPA
jgi:hypothetical protein